MSSDTEGFRTSRVVSKASSGSRSSRTSGICVAKCTPKSSGNIGVSSDSSRAGAPLVTPASKFEEEDATLQRWSLLLSIVPAVCPLVAFVGYDGAVGAFHDVITLGKTWYTVDGGELERQLLIPVINGIVLPSIGLVLATAVSTTLSTLRQRQVIIRECLNKEITDLTTVTNYIDVLFGRFEEDYQTRSDILLLLRKYVERIILESRSTLSGSSVKALAASQKRCETALIRFHLSNASQRHRTHSDVTRKGLMDDPFLFYLPETLRQIDYNRSTRLANLLTSYPAQHWIIISMLYFSVVLCFLEESDGAAVQFLGGVQLRGLFTILVGVASAIASLLIDLNDPFRGNFSIKQTTDQLGPLLRTIDSAILSAFRQPADMSVDHFKSTNNTTITHSDEGKLDLVASGWLTEDECEGDVFCLVE